MRKNSSLRRKLNIFSGAILLVVLLFGIYLAVKNFKLPTYTALNNSVSSQNDNSSKFTLPHGLQTYQIVQAAGKRPAIYTATIDPPDVHVGDKQTLSIIVSDPDGIASAEAQIQTDHSTTTLPLNYVRVVDDTEIKPSAYSVDSNGQLVINEKLRDEQLAKESGKFMYQTTLVKAVDFLNLHLKPSVAKATPGQKLLYQATWTVQDTHDTKYHTTFVVKNVKGDVNSITLAWSDACNIPRSGAWNINIYGPCTISSPDGVDNGAATIATYTLTLISTFAYNSGQSITITSGAIAIGSGGIIQKTYIWAHDVDGDGYDTGSWTDQDSSPGAGYYRRYTRSGTDCNDGNASLYQNLTGYTDSDGDTYTTGGAQSICSGASLPAGYRSSANGADCNDGNANVFQNISNLGQDNDGDQYYTGSLSTVCVGSILNAKWYKDASNVQWITSAAASGSGDCDDTNNNIFRTLSVYWDRDQDGWTTGGLVSACVGTSATINGRTYYYTIVGFGGYYYGATSAGTDCLEYDGFTSNTQCVFQSSTNGCTDKDHDHYCLESTNVASQCVGSTADNIWYGSNRTAACPADWLRASQVSGFNDADDNNAAVH